jgi:ubiquinone biosynthesis protein UbiJ
VVNNLIAVINWAIEKDEPFHRALKGLSGKRIRIVFPVGGSVDWSVERDGLLKEVDLKSSRQTSASDASGATAVADPDVTIVVGTDLQRPVRIEGDAMVAERLGPLIGLIKERVSPWDRFWKNSPAGLIAKQVADYAIHESDFLVTRPQADAHHQEIRSFRDAIDRLEKRVDQLARR